MKKEASPSLSLIPSDKSLQTVTCAQSQATISLVKSSDSTLSSSALTSALAPSLTSISIASSLPQATGTAKSMFGGGSTASVSNSATALSSSQGIFGSKPGSSSISGMVY